MAHHVEPMDVDDIESDFDNKENTYHHSNVLPRTPCTEKGYEELDVSELTMKLRYSITPAASPMSKSMSHCLDNRYNASTDESLNNTVINENGNNLTHSLHSALNKTDLKSPKALPLQSLPADLTADISRNATVLQSLGTKIDNNNIKITVSNENEIDNLSFPSSSSSMTHTPEATTPTKEIPKDGGSPIMRGLKSVLSMFRSSQSPIPPAEADNKAMDAVQSPTDVQLPDCKNQATASTPINLRNKERSPSRRNSTHRESIVFNEDLEKELQWNDDSTIVFSTEKIPIHKLFFQDKPASSKIVNLEQPVNEDVNSSVEYMDVSYNDISMREKTMNATGNKSTVTDVPESDGEFVDCETTITQDTCPADTEESSDNFDMKHQNNPEKVLPENNAAVIEIPFMDTTVDILKLINQNDPEKVLHENNAAAIEIPFMNTTVDILKLIDGSQIDINADQTVKELDFSTTDIVNQLSDLINASETKTDVSLDKHKLNLSNTEIPKTNLLEQTLTKLQPSVLETSSENTAVPKNIITVNDAEDVTIKNENIKNVLGNLPTDTLDCNIEPVLPIMSSACAEVISTITCNASTTQNNDNEKSESFEETSGSIPIHPSPCDIPLPNEGNDLTDNLMEENQHTEIISAILPMAETAQISLLAALDKTIELTPEIKLEHIVNENENTDISCQLSILPSDVPLPEVDNNHVIKINSLPHEAVTVVPDPVQPEIALATDNVAVVDNTDLMDNVSHSENAGDEIVTQSIILQVPLITNTVDPNEEEKMDMSYCEQIEEKLPQNLDVAATIVSSVQLDETVKIADSLTVIELTDVNSPEINIVSEEDIVGTKKLIENKLFDPLLDIETENAFKENSGNIEVLENALPDPNVVETNTSSVLEMREVPQTSVYSNVIETKSPDVKKDEIQEIISGTTNNIASTYTSEAIESFTPIANVSCSDISSLPATPLVENTDEVKTEATTTEDVKVAETLNDVSTKEDSDRTNILKKQLQPEEGIDEEIVLSENSSPFVSISAEEKKYVQDKNENIEDNANLISNKSPSPPLSPKIVSKGYNLNFDDLDAINPFATKTKIRMSPPPGASPNRLLEVDPVEHKKIEKMEFFDNGKNENRRKSMPEKRKPLKSKSKFNSTFDSTSKIVEPKTQKAPLPSQKDADIGQNYSQICDKAQTDYVTMNTSEVKPDAISLDETCQVTDKVVDSQVNITLPITVLDNSDNTTNIIEDVVFSESCKSPLKSDNTSSSEQSAYFSTATSSTECNQSKNVFNLPEIDDKDFNPFATKSKIRLSPPPDLDMVNPFATKSKIKSSPETSFVITPNNANTTVTVYNENEFKHANLNLSNCSGISRTSDEKEVTVQEVHTEDEDTIEGPFLEAEDGNEADKISEFNDDKLEAEDEAAEMFIDAEAFEFLMNQNNTDEVAYSGKESLFLKFDPLFSQRVTSEGVAAALSEIKKRQSTPKKTPKPMPPKDEELMSFEKPVAGPSDLNNTHSVECDVEDIHGDLNVTVLSKPMMAVTPAVNPVVTPKKPLTPTRANRLSMTFTSPAMAVIDRLLSLSGNSPSAGFDTTVTHASRERTEADQALTQLRELLAEKEINVYNLRCESKELKERLSTLEAQMKSLEAVSSERLQNINELTENLSEKTKMNRSMAAVVEEYERTIASLISETEQDKKRYAEERMQLIRERDEQTTHLTSMEVSFSDLHSKYEKSKQVILGYKTNEEAYKKSIKEFEDNLAKMYSNYELLKQHATSKLNHANQELEKLNKAHEAEVLKYNAMIKRKDLHITSLEETLTQKTKANEELTAICDELINKVG